VGIILVVSYMVGLKLFISMGLMSYSPGSSLITSLAALAFTFALAARFNGEFEALQKLQGSLEDQVAQRTKELQKANQEIQDLSRQKTTFFLNIAHEIRTPLTLLSNYLTLYREKHQGEELNVMQSAVDKMSTDVINYMDTEKILSGTQVYLQDSSCDAADVIRILLPLFQSYAKEKQIHVIAHFPESLWIRFDPSALERVLRNLLMNALKYAGLGAEVSVLMETRGDKVIIMIADNGPGIPVDKIDRVVKPFVQLSGSKENYQGMGLGLFIVQSVMTEGGGSLEISPGVEKGTTAVLTFRRCEGLPAPSPRSIQVVNRNDSPNSVSQTTRKKSSTVLVVEDNADLRALLVRKLGGDFQVLEAAEGQEALQIMENQNTL